MTARVSTAILVPLSLRQGGSINYYLEFIIGVCLCSALMLPQLIHDLELAYRTNGPFFKQASLIIAVGIFVLWQSPQEAFPFPNEQYDRDALVVTKIISDTNKPVPGENAAIVTNAGKQLVAEYFNITNMTRRGTWDETNYLDNYKNQYYDYIIMRIPISDRPNGDGHFLPEVMKAISDNYVIYYDPPQNFYWYGLTVYISKNHLAEKGN